MNQTLLLQIEAYESEAKRLAKIVGSSFPIGTKILVQRSTTSSYRMKAIVATNPLSSRPTRFRARNVNTGRTMSVDCRTCVVMEAA